MSGEDVLHHRIGAVEVRLGEHDADARRMWGEIGGIRERVAVTDTRLEAIEQNQQAAAASLERIEGRLNERIDGLGDLWSVKVRWVVGTLIAAAGVAAAVLSILADRI